jgi:hypothetical protein
MVNILSSYDRYHYNESQIQQKNTTFQLVNIYQIKSGEKIFNNVHNYVSRTGSGFIGNTLKSGKGKEAYPGKKVILELPVRSNESAMSDPWITLLPEIFTIPPVTNRPWNSPPVN